jgi:hypothetical protein
VRDEKLKVPGESADAFRSAIRLEVQLNTGLIFQYVIFDPATRILVEKIPTLPPSMMESFTQFECPLTEATAIVLLSNLKLAAVFFLLLSALFGEK